MSVEIKPVNPTRAELTRFVKFGISLYEGNGCYVPPLVLDEVETLSPHKNPAFDFCRAQSFMAYRDGEGAGRITAIINDQVNARTGRKQGRFGFVEFVDDPEVSAALFKAAEEWARSNGMTEMIGPMGFSDMDHEGMLVEGFGEKGTMATIYNHPYYPAHMERLGYVKDVDWIEFRIDVPSEVPEKMARIAEIVKKKYNLRVLKYKSGKKIKAEYGQELFRLINEAYDKLYGYSPLTPRQVDYYIDMYLSILNLDFVTVVVDGEGKLVAVGITMPSLSDALRRSRGRLFPFGWYHLLRALHGKTDTVDLMLIAVSPEYMNKGVNSLLFADLIPVFNRYGMRYAESNLELETNSSVQAQWEYFTYRQHRRRRAFRKNL